MENQSIHEKLDSLSINIAVMGNQLVNIERRLDGSDARQSKLEGKVETLTAIDVDTINKVNLLSKDGVKREENLDSWKVLIRNNISSILTAILIAYLMYRFGLN